MTRKNIYLPNMKQLVSINILDLQLVEWKCVESRAEEHSHSYWWWLIHECTHMSNLSKSLFKCVHTLLSFPEYSSYTLLHNIRTFSFKDIMHLKHIVPIPTLSLFLLPVIILCPTDSFASTFIIYKYILLCIYIKYTWVYFLHRDQKLQSL